jgi:tRNA pseudouridine55 synthase
LIDGILLLDKPLGLSSTGAGLRVRRLLGAAKAGHVGSLDPLATGMLPICLGEATKVAGEILEGRKVYRFTVALGARTATGDAEGEVVERVPVPAFDAAAVRAAMQGFLGDSLQVPPMYSAIKQGGQPLYKLARAGKEVVREPRPIHIDRLELIGLEAAADGLPTALDCRVVCGKGTFVRVLSEDLARALGTVGHVTALRREQVEPFGPERLVSLAEVEASAEAGRAAGLPPDAVALRPPLTMLGAFEALPQLPALALDAEATRRLLHGQPVSVAGALGLPLAQRVRLSGPDGVFLGLGEVAAPGRVAPKRLVARQANE